MSATFVAPDLSAQLTSEWNTVYAVATNPISDVVREMACAGDGNYLLMTSSAILRTTDAGRTWTSVVTREMFTPEFTHIAYPDTGSIVYTSDSTTYGSTWYHGMIEATTDGGSTWTRTVLPVPSRMSDVAMVDRMHGLACAYVRNAPGSLLRTSDGGLTWQSLPMPPRSAGPFDLQMLGPDWWAMRAYDSISGTWGLFRTADAGVTWNRFVVPEFTSSIDFINSLHAYAVGAVYSGDSQTHNRIDRTTDGGATWTTVLRRPVERWGSLREIAFADSAHGIAAGSEGIIYRTTDGGATWMNERATADLVEFGFACVGIGYPRPDEAIIAGNVGAIAYRGRQTLVPPRMTSPTWAPDPGALEQTISWTSVVGATRYDVQVGDTNYDHNITDNRFFDVPYFATTTSDTCVPVTLREHTRYYFRVRSRNDSLVSDWSDRAHKRTIGEPIIVPMPSITHPEHLSADVPLETDLTWTPVPNVLGYDYRIALERTFLFTHQDEENVRGTSVPIRRLQPDAQYYARVCARDSSGELSEYDVISFWTSAPSSADAPASVIGSASLRPNVATDETALHITVARPGVVGIRVVDVRGSEVLALPPAQVEPGERTLRIDLSGLASGRYTVAVDVDGRRVALPVVVIE
jgi:photosystem II stability/assembly factor-like uncharacterized protein